MKVQDKLGKDRFKVRETSHIVVEKQIKDMELAKKLCLACPAGALQHRRGGEPEFQPPRLP